MSYPTPQQPAAALALTAKFFPMAFIFFFVKPKVIVNGHLVPAIWGRNVIPLPPGRHHVRVFTPYFLPPEVGPAETMFDLAPGQLLELEYRSPLIVFMSGALGAPPQKYKGLPIVIAIYAIVLLFVICSCMVPLLTQNN